MRVLLFLIASFVLLVSGCGEYVEEPEKVFPVTSIVAEEETISRIVMAPCRLEGSEEAVIMVSTPGRIEGVFVSEGDFVTEGQQLVQLVTDDLYAGETGAAAARVEAARVNVEYAEARLSRASRLIDSGAVSPQEYEAAESAAETARATLDQAVAGYRSSAGRAAGGSVVAPFSGQVIMVRAKEGNTASGPLVSMIGSGTLRTELLFAERYLFDLREGLPVFFVTELCPGEMFDGLVVSSSPAVDPVSGLVSVVVQIDDASGKLRSGMTGIATVVLETLEATPVLPQKVLRPTGNDQWEIAVIENGRVDIRSVETGIVNGNLFQISSGLSPGDSVIHLGCHLVSEGSLVRVVER